MPLTTRTNGSSGSNQITAAWFNDFLNLFTGVMLDQPITFKPDVTLTPIGGVVDATAPTLALVTGTALGIGAYLYSITYIAADGGETGALVTATITTTTGNQAVNLSAIPTGPTGTTKRGIYRSAVGGTALSFVATINDNTTTTYSDTTPDASLGGAAPLHPWFGGSLVLRDAGGTNPTLILTNDGTIYGDVTLKAWYGAPGAAPTLALHAGTTLGIGVYKYVVTFVSSYGDATGESLQSPLATITTTSNNQQVTLSNIPLGPTGTSWRRIYRTTVGGSTYELQGTIFDNTTTTLLDATADGSLAPAVNPPTHPTFGGSLIIKDQTDAETAIIYSDGTATFKQLFATSVSFDAGGFISDGAGNVTAKMLTLTAASPANQIVFTDNSGSTKGGVALNDNGYMYIFNQNTSPYGFRFQSNSTVVAHLDNNGTNTSVLLHSQQLSGSPDYAETTFMTSDGVLPGMVVCPARGEDEHGDHWMMCSHEDCRFAKIVSTAPGMTVGGRVHQFMDGDVLEFAVDEAPHWKPIAVSGRVPANISGEKQDYEYLMLVVSNGDGTVRQARDTDKNILGFITALGVDGMGKDMREDQVLVMLK